MRDNRSLHDGAVESSGAVMGIGRRNCVRFPPNGVSSFISVALRGLHALKITTHLA